MIVSQLQFLFLMFFGVSLFPIFNFCFRSHLNVFNETLIFKRFYISNQQFSIYVSKFRIPKTRVLWKCFPFSIRHNFPSVSFAQFGSDANKISLSIIAFVGSLNFLNLVKFIIFELTLPISLGWFISGLCAKTESSSEVFNRIIPYLTSEIKCYQLCMKPVSKNENSDITRMCNPNHVVMKNIMTFIICNKHIFRRIESDSVTSSSFARVLQTLDSRVWNEDDKVRISLSDELGPFPTLIKTLDSKPSGLVIPLSGFHGRVRPRWDCSSFCPQKPGSYVFRAAFFRSQIFTGSFIETDRIQISILKVMWSKFHKNM